MPRLVRLWFDEPTAPRFSSARLFDGTGRPIEPVRVDGDPADPNLLVVHLPEVADSAYSLLWEVLSESDGHLSRGLIVIGVGMDAAPSAAPAIELEDQARPYEVLARWLLLGALVTLAGGVVIVQFVLPNPGGDAVTGTTKEILLAARRRIWSWLLVCALLAVLAAFALLAEQTATLRTAPAQPSASLDVLILILTKTRWGVLWLARQFALILLLIVIYTGRRAVMREGEAAKPTRATANALCLALIMVQTSSGHAAGITPNTALVVVVYALHLLAASVWMGGLIALAAGMLPALRRREHATRYVHTLWRPFSRAAALSVGALVATGLFATGQQVASPDALLTTAYGRILVGKLGLVAIAGALGLFNAMLLHPRLATPLALLLRRPLGWTPVGPARFHHLIAGEIAAGVVVVLATGILTATPPPRGAEFVVAPNTVPTSLTQSVDDLVVTLTVKPNRPGQNVLQILAGSIRRPPPAEIMRVMARFTSLEEELTPVTATAEAVDKERFLLSGSQLKTAGRWQIEVVVRRAGLEDSSARFDWVVLPPGAVRPVLLSKHPWRQFLTVAAASFMLLLVAGLAAMPFVRRLVRHRRRYGSPRFVVNARPRQSDHTVDNRLGGD